MNGEFLCFTFLSNFVKKIICQTLRRRANLEKTYLIRRTTYQFCISDSFDTCMGVSMRRTTVIRCFEQFALLLKVFIYYILASLFLSLKDSTCETKKNYFYFTLKALFVLEKIRSQNFRYSSLMTSSMRKHKTKNTFQSVNEIWPIYVVLQEKM